MMTVVVVIPLFLLLWMSCIVLACFPPLCDFKTGYLFKNNILVLPFMEPFSIDFSPVCISLVIYDSIACNLTEKMIIIKGSGIVFQSNTTFELAYWKMNNEKERRSMKYRITDLAQIDFESYNNDASLEEEKLQFIDVTWPPYGHITSGNFFAVLNRTSTLLSLAQVSIKGIREYDIYLSSDNIIQTQEIMEPASWFVNVSLSRNIHEDISYPNSIPLLPSLNPRYSSNALLFNPSYDFYIEFILDRANILKERLFSSRNQGSVISTLAADAPTTVDSRLQFWLRNEEYVHDPFAIDSIDNGTDSRINICIWTSDKIDGQKTIWINQVEHLISNYFRFTFTIVGNISESNDFLDKLNSFDPNFVSILESPKFEVDLADTLEKPLDGSEPFDHQRMDPYRYIHDRFDKAELNISKTDPKWVQHMLYNVINHLSSLQCDIVVYGNNRDSVADTFITDASRSLHIPTVTELMNLFGSPLAVPDVVVSPSRYGLMHHSMHDTLYHRFEDPLIRLHEYPMSVVISPGVDVNKFDRHRYGDVSKRYDFPGCSRICVDNANGSNISDRIDNKNNSSSNDDNNDDCCFVIGFMARIAPEKSPGLFVMAAAEYLQRNHQARYLMIGDGSLMESIKELTIRLGVYWAFEFVGWVSPDMLPWYLMSMSVVVNPSLRAWSETFCIANIEVMSMGIPLITFGVGGVGEYVLRSSHSTKDSLFDVTENAILVNEASPQAIAMALDCIWKNKTLGMELGQRGRDVVENYFNIKYQMSQYRSLYRYIYENHK